MSSDTCGCCKPEAASTPVKIFNRPGLSAVAYRVGTYSSFRQTMLQAISSVPELSSLGTRLSDDYSITLLEMWAALADILTFYQERAANEAYLRTAQLRDSVQQLSRLLSYQLRPGVAAGTRLAFKVEKDKTVAIPVGLRVQSVPGQNETPQTFETLEKLTADARLNSLTALPAPVAAYPFADGATEAYLEPSARGLAAAQALVPEDMVVLYHEDAEPEVEELTVKEVKVGEGQMVLTWSGALKGTWDSSPALTSSPRAYKYKRKLRLFGFNGPLSYMVPVYSPASPGNYIVGWTEETLSPSYPKSSPENEATLLLDSRYDDLKVGTRLLVTGLAISAAPVRLATVTRVEQAQDSFGNLTDTVTKLTTDVEDLLCGEDRRQVVVYELVGEQIPFWGYAYPETITLPAVYVPGRLVDSKTVTIGQTVDGTSYTGGDKIALKEIESGREVVLADGEQTPVCAKISAASLVGMKSPAVTPSQAGDWTYLKLDLEIASGTTLSLDAESTELLGNVAQAGHGETVTEEVLGSGDGSLALQSFTLKKAPVTQVASSASTGATSSLQVLVNDALWEEVTGLYGQKPTAQVYTSEVADDGTMRVQFGDGKTGARLPSGRSNVVASYRHGLGLYGNVKADTLSTLLDQVVGLESATNPAAASGGADPETLAQAKKNAPTTVKTLGRAVSLLDVEDLAAAMSQVAKAKACWVYDGEGRVVYVTVAGVTWSREATMPRAMGRSKAAPSLRRSAGARFTVTRTEPR